MVDLVDGDDLASPPGDVAVLVVPVSSDGGIADIASKHDRMKTALAIFDALLARRKMHTDALVFVVRLTADRANAILRDGLLHSETILKKTLFGESREDLK